MNEKTTASKASPPLLAIGIAGPSACGKSVLAESLQSCFTEGSVSYLDLDGYHLRTREQRRAIGEVPDQPSANDLKQAITDMQCLRRGRSVRMPVYDHSSGEFSKPYDVAARPLVIVEGLHALHLNELSGSELIDLGVFVHPTDSLREEWKVRRDVEFRNYTAEQVRAEIAARRPHREEHVDPQLIRADLVLQMRRMNPDKIDTRTLISVDFFHSAFGLKHHQQVFDLVFKRAIESVFGRDYYLLSLAIDDLPEALRKRERVLYVERTSVREHDPTPTPLLYNVGADMLFRIILMLLLGEVD